ncbi:MAG: MBL fold metallo-hydrolase [Phycisphaerales bacterium]|nr:MBL fold metallo-hydrolase [Phycisphaerales bacterium]
MQIHFHGATQTVTGSLHEIRFHASADRTILLDVGLFQGPREMARQINSNFQLDPKSVHAVILSHAHQDHCGNLPNLAKQGFSGPIYCTRATAAIAALMLMDSAKIQEEDAAYLNQKTVKSWKHNNKSIQPLYTREDAEKAISLFKPLEYRELLDLGGGTVELRDAGHTLGSASVRLTETAGVGGTTKKLVFTGDVGRRHSPILREPDPFNAADALITECTYGGKRHTPISQVPIQLTEVINQTAKRNGILMIPAFALGRTQSVVQVIHELRLRNKIPQKLPIYVDSPLATRITEVHRRFSNLFDDATRAMTQPFDFPNLTYVGSPDQSRALNTMRGPFIVIAGSGMCEAGRILHHLKHHITDPRNMVLLPGYQAVHTLGWRIQNRDQEVPILGDMIPLRCQVEEMHGLSAHADGKELLHFTKSLKNARTYLVHGEIPQAQAHEKTLRAAGFANVAIPIRGDVADV